MSNKHVVLVGAGLMSAWYAEVLKALHVNFIVVGRGEESAAQFHEKTGIEVVTGGIENYITNVKPGPDTHFIIATNVDALLSTCKFIINGGYRQILAEKPGGATLGEIRKLHGISGEHNAQVFLGYNRRFYDSVQQTRDIIEKDGGIRSFTFSFTELGFKIAKIPKAAVVKENWFLANSTHVVDLAFYLCGIPEKINAHQSGSLSWHPRAAVFTGSGVTTDQVPFTYHANWDSPGNWGLEIFTDEHKLILNPIEELKIQRKGSFEINKVEARTEWDGNFKPGLYRQVVDFLEGRKDTLCSIDEQQHHLKYYEEISGYKG